MRKTTLAITAASLAITPLVAVSSASAQATDDAAMVAPVEEDNDFPWGLLGLLGLAGLLGRNRRDDDIHVNRTGGTTNRK